MIVGLFIKGGPIMWPLLVVSVVAVTVTIERVVFLVGEARRRQAHVVAEMLAHVSTGQREAALRVGEASTDVIARMLTDGLRHSNGLLAHALMMAANRELRRYSRGVTILDTIITLAPLLGLFGTVTGMIGAFGLLGQGSLDAPTAITGGIAEALIATAFGLVIAMVALLPFNYLNDEVEAVRHEMEQAATQLEVLSHSS